MYLERLIGKILTIAVLGLGFFEVAPFLCKPIIQESFVETFQQPIGPRGDGMMIDYTLDETNSVLHVRPAGPLQEKDFEALSQAVDPFIERNGGLNGLLLEVALFPGWTNLVAATIKHFPFGHLDEAKTWVASN